MKWEKSICTNNLAEFGIKGRNILIKLLESWRNQGLPDDFSEKNVVALMNKITKEVFLLNDRGDASMLNGETLEMLYTCKNCYQTGFKEIYKFNDDGCTECLIF